MRYLIQRINEYGTVVDEDVDKRGPMPRCEAETLRFYFMEEQGDLMHILVPVGGEG
tara:strand:+ start:4693 stop:4860 length:168 start_codon:yes stop_codon:yes gene_type:complete